MYESFDWDHGVFIGAAMKSEATAAAEHKGKVRAEELMAGNSLRVIVRQKTIRTYGWSTH